MGLNVTIPCNTQIFSTERYRALNFDGIVGYPKLIPPEMRDKLPIFSGMKHESKKMHLKKFSNLIDDYELDDEDVVIRLCVQSLMGEAREWF